MDTTLNLVTTPIGNLSDISARALDALKSADIVIAEDTRVTRKLYELLDIDRGEREFVSFHEHNQDQVLSLIEKASRFDFPIIVSDAGSPVLSDPAFPFVKEWKLRGGKVTSCPGPTSVTVALELSGLPPVPFLFHGFLPKKEEAKKGVLKACCAGVTHIFFESPHRVKATVSEIFEVYPDCELVICRELTKKFEEARAVSRITWEEEHKEKLNAKGEFVLVFHHKSLKGGKIDNDGLVKLTEAYLNKPTPKKLAKVISQITGDKISSIYEKITSN